MGIKTEPKPDPEEIARPTRDPALLPHAELITAEAGEMGTPLSWRLQKDGQTLSVVLPSGKKISRPMPGAAGTVTTDEPTPAPIATIDEPAGGPKPMATPAKKSETKPKAKRRTRR